MAADAFEARDAAAEAPDTTALDALERVFETRDATALDAADTGFEMLVGIYADTLERLGRYENSLKLMPYLLNCFFNCNHFNTSNIVLSMQRLI